MSGYIGKPGASSVRASVRGRGISSSVFKAELYSALSRLQLRLS